MTRVSVIIPTYNRADILRQTLESMTHLDTDGISIEFVVIDNNSSDTTKDIIESFYSKLPIRHLFEPKPGKSRALNRALEDANLGEIVVFTDDDIIPQKDWLKAIISISNRCPQYSVFGGKVELIWSETKIPGWAQHKAIWHWAFGHHDQGDSDSHYLPGNYPGGANFWVRRKVLSEQKRFDCSRGPYPARAMGTEGSFLYQFVAEGYGMMYSPDAVVKHLVNPALLSETNIRKRAYRRGRGMPRTRISHPILFQRCLFIWRCLRILSLMRHVIRYVCAMISISRDRRVIKSLDVISGIGYDVEALRISFRYANKT